MRPLFLTLLLTLTLPLTGLRAQCCDVGFYVDDFIQNYGHGNFTATGTVIDVFCTVQNRSNQPVPEFRISVVAEEVNTGNRYRLQNRRYENFAANSSVEYRTTVGFNSQSTIERPPHGTYRIVMIADLDEVLDDPDRSNNELYLTPQNSPLQWGESTTAIANLADLGLSELTAWPNPASLQSTFNLRLQRPSANLRPLTLELRSLGGQLVWQQPLAAQSQHQTVTLQAPNAAGVYLLRVSDGQVQTTMPILWVD